MRHRTPAVGSGVAGRLIGSYRWRALAEV